MINPLQLEGRRVLVTGASSGIGAETAVFLSSLGARVVLTARDITRLAQTASRLEGSDHVVEAFDLSRLADIPGWLAQLAASGGPFSGLVHCAGVAPTKPLRIVEPGDIDAVMHVNVSAAIALAKGFRQKGVVAGPGASIVFISSVMGLIGSAGRTVYSASKGALIALAKSLAIELSREHVRVNCVAPGYVVTPMFESLSQILTEEQIAAITAAHPLGLGKPQDVANAIAFLLADTGRWITGSTLVVDGGYTAK